MKRTNELNLALLSSIAAATLVLSSCSHATPKRCVDANMGVRPDQYCDDQQRSGGVSGGLGGGGSEGYPYRWYYGGTDDYVPVGQTISGGSFTAPADATSFSHPTSGDTVRGMFGGSAEAHGVGE